MEDGRIRIYGFGSGSCAGAQIYIDEVDLNRALSGGEIHVEED